MGKGREAKCSDMNELALGLGQDIILAFIVTIQV